MPRRTTEVTMLRPEYQAAAERTARPMPSSAASARYGTTVIGLDSASEERSDAAIHAASR